MTIIDVNLLVYAHDADSPQHTRTVAWLDELFEGPEWIGFPWQIIWAFVRISTNKYIQLTPRTPESAFAAIRDWLAQPRVVVVQPGPRHLEIVESLVVTCPATGPLVTDAVLAALAIEHNAVLATNDSDFNRFPNLKVVNPLKTA